MDAVATRLTRASEGRDLLQIELLSRLLKREMSTETIMMQKLLEAMPPAPQPAHLGQNIDLKI